VGAASLAAPAPSGLAASQATQATSGAGLVAPAGAVFPFAAAVGLAAPVQSETVASLAVPARSEAEALRGVAMVQKVMMAMAWLLRAVAGAAAAVPRGAGQCPGPLQPAAAAAAGVLRANATAAAQAAALLEAGKVSVASCMGGGVMVQQGIGQLGCADKLNTLRTVLAWQQVTAQVVPARALLTV
jgi:hypothetical protein